MSAFALSLVLAAAILHAGWNVVAKKAGGDSRFVLMVAVFIVVVWAPVGLWVGWDAVPRWGFSEWALIVASGLMHLAYFNVLLRGYAASDLTVVYPVARGTGPLAASVGALLLLGESLTWLSGLGVAAITAGVFLIAGGPGLWAKAHDPAQRRRVQAGIAWGVATGLLISGYTLIDGYAVKVWLISPVLIDYFGNFARIPFMLPAALRDRPRFMEAVRTQWKHALLIAAVSPLAYVLVLYAVQIAPLSHVAPAREVSMLFAALFGGRLLGEGDRGLRLAGAACMALGVTGLALG
jgi:drug/metabolite transporter (DMT)-like permease